MQILKGKLQAPVRGIIYGTEGIGKTSLAAELPDALILDTEDGSKQIDCARALCLDWRSIEHAVKELIKDSQGFKSVIIDSADWMEKALQAHMLRLSGKKSIEDYGYGKGYTMVAEEVASFLALLDQLVAKGIHVVFIAHAKVVRTSPPDETDGYDRYELKLTKQVGPLLKEWADVILFCNYKINLVEGTDKKIKAQGGKERVMYSERRAAWDAKNRFGLPEEMPMVASEIMHLFTGAQARTSKPTEKAVEKPVEKPTEEKADTITAEQIEKLELYLKNSVGKPIIMRALEKVEAVDVGDLAGSHAAELISEVQKAMNNPVPPGLSGMFEAHEDQVNKYLVSINWIATGKTWRDLSAENLEIIKSKTARFMKAAGIKEAA